VRALTIRQPWAELIIRGEKDVENRSWKTDHRGPLLIHAATAVDRAACEAHGISLDVPRGALVGIVELVDVTRDRTSRWHKDGRWGWYLARARRFDRPVPLPGRRILFDVPDRKVAAQLGGRRRPSRRR
jgi:hypothetical protein